MPKAADAQRTGFSPEDVRDGVCGYAGYAFTFASSDCQLIEIDLLYFDPVFPEGDELQERRVVFLFVSVGSTDPSLNLLGS